MTDKQLKAIGKMVSSGRMKFNEPLAAKTTMGAGGPALVFARPGSIDELKTMLELSRLTNLGLTVLGKGSNVIIRDKGIKGIVISLAGDFTRVSWSGRIVTAGAGMSLSVLVNESERRGMSGLEFAAGIPGTAAAW